MALKSNCKHGMSKLARSGKLPEYAVWQMMRQRCENPRQRTFKHYGGRGISVCPEWKDFARFLADMGLRPARNLTLERRDNNKGYCKENCYWATRQQQCQNTRRNVMLTFRGNTLCMVEWARLMNLPYDVLRTRLRDGWDISKALTEPLMNRPPVMLTLNGRTETITEWSRLIGIDRETIRRRLNYGWSDERALTEPLHECGGRTHKT